MKNIQIKHFQQEFFPRIFASIWSFVFVLIFRFSLNNLYPFWSGYLKLSFFAFIFVAIIWLSFFWHFHHHKEKKKKSYLYFILAFVNVLFLILGFISYGINQFFYLNPLLSSILFFLIFFLYSAKLPFFLSYRLSVFIGIVAGFIPLTILQNPFFIFSTSFIIMVLPNRWLHINIFQHPSHKTRLLPLRLSLDYLRFLFLGLSLYNIFDEYRSHFYFIFSIIFMGTFLQVVISKIDHRKHHIKYGIMALFSIFIVLAIAYHFLLLIYFAAIGYTLLALWEGIYFKKMTEGYLKREQILIGMTIFFTLISLLITVEWNKLLLGFTIVGTQIIIFIFIFKSYRQIIASLFLISILVWGGVLYNNLSESLIKEFFIIKEKKVKNNLDLSWLLKVEKNQNLYTNLYPKEIIENPKIQKIYFNNIHYYNPPGFLVLNNLLFKKKFNNEKKFFLLNISKMHPYNTKKGTENFLLFIKKNNYNNIILLNKNKNNDLYLLYPTLPKYIQNINLKTLDTNKKEFLKKVITVSRDYLLNIYDYKNALQTQQLLLEIEPTNKNIYKKLASICGAMSGKIELQVDYLEKYLYFNQSTDIEVLKKLMELYFLQNKLFLSKQKAEQLIRLDSKNRFTYYKWIFKIIQSTQNRNDWHRFYYKIKSLQVEKNSYEALEKQTLIQNILETIESNPSLGELIEIEKNRQEHIELPQ